MFRKKQSEPTAHFRPPITRTQRRAEAELAESRFVFDVEVAYGGLSHLRHTAGRAHLPEYLSQLWKRRHFIWRETRSKFATQNENNVLGQVWLILRPMLDAFFYYAIFGLLLNASRGHENYVAFIIVGILTFQYTTRAITAGTTCMRGARGMIRGFAFPRASIPVASSLHDMINMGPTLAVMIIAIMIIPPHEWPAWTWLLCIPLFALNTLFNLGLTLIFARLGHMLPDLANLTSFGTRILMYGSGVIFPITRFIHDPTILAIVEANPILVIANMYRSLLIDETIPDAGQWGVLSAWAVGAVVFGFLFFYAGEESYSHEQRPRRTRRS